MSCLIFAGWRVQRWWVAGVFVIAGLILGSAAATAEKRVALVVGIGGYSHLPKLDNPPKDAIAMADRLRGLGFEIEQVVLDPDRRSLEDAIRKFRDKAAKADVALVFLAGHGTQIKGDNSFFPKDAEFRTDEGEQELRDSAIDVNWVLREMSGAKRLRILLLDACRDNPFMEGGDGSRGIRRQAGLAPVDDLADTVVAYAAAANKTAADGLGQSHSPFTAALLNHLGDPGSDVRVMFGKVVGDVLRATGQKQRPYLYASIADDEFSFNPLSTPVPDVKSGSPVQPLTPAPQPSLSPPNQAYATARDPGLPPVSRPSRPSILGIGAGRYLNTYCGSILDRSSGFEWFIGPDNTGSLIEARSWINQLRTCGGGWQMPSVAQLEYLYDKGREGGIGFIEDVDDNLPRCLAGSTCIDPTFAATMRRGLRVWGNTCKGIPPARCHEL